MYCQSSWLLQHRQHYLVEKRLEGSCCENAPVRLQAEFGLCTVDGYSNAALLHYGICSHHREISSARTFLGSNFWVAMLLTPCQSSGNGLLTSLGVAAAIRFCSDLRAAADPLILTFEAQKMLPHRSDGANDRHGTAAEFYKDL